MKANRLAAALAVLLTLAAVLPLGAQSVDEISLDARATFHQETRDGVYDSHFQGDYLNIHIKGTLSETVSYRVRQRLNKDIEARNPFKATDFLWIHWQPNTHWGFTFGKQAILVGGYEFDSPPIEVYYYSAFCNGMSQVYAFGAAAHYTPVDGQTISLQFIPSPISPPTQNTYSYNLYWSGSIVPKWKTLWSVNLVEDEYHRKMNYIALGNKFFFGPLVVDIDYINRTAAGHPRFFSDGTVIDLHRRKMEPLHEGRIRMERCGERRRQRSVLRPRPAGRQQLSLLRSGGGILPARERETPPARRLFPGQPRYRQQLRHRGYLEDENLVILL